MRQMHPSPLVVAAILASAMAGFVSFAPVYSADTLDERITKLIDGERYGPSLWGILVVDRAKGDTIWQRNAGKMFAPASVTKLFSTSAAWDAFGPDHRFATTIHRRGEIVEGVLQGDLILRAGGDLTLGGRTTSDGKIAFHNADHTYSNFYDTAEITEPDPLAGLNQLAAQIAEAGIRRVTGDLMIDDSLFDHATGSGSGPGQLTPLMINDNIIDLVITPTKPGQPAKLTWRPESAAVRVVSKMFTGEVGGKVETSIRGSALDTIVVSGLIPSGHRPLVRFFEVPRPLNFARTLWHEALSRAGVKVMASVKRFDNPAWTDDACVGVAANIAARHPDCVFIGAQ